MEIRQLTEKDRESLLNLIDTIEEKLENKTWWLPISAEALENFFNKDWTIFYGAFDGEKLVAASALFINKYYFESIVSHLENVDINKFGKIGRCMVHPDYRGNNLMFKINQKLVKIAKSMNLEYLGAIAHPQNIASNTSLQKLGLRVAQTIIKDGKYPRNILCAKLSEI